MTDHDGLVRRLTWREEHDRLVRRVLMAADAWTDVAMILRAPVRDRVDIEAELYAAVKSWRAFHDRPETGQTAP